MMEGRLLAAGALLRLYKELLAMKKIISLLLSAALLLALLSACQEPAPSVSSAPAKDWAVNELASLAFDYSGREDQDGLESVHAETDREWITTYLENAYGLQEPWVDAAMIRATGASAFEIAVLRMEDEGAAVRAATAFMNYISARQGDFTGYAPAEADMAANGEILQEGPYAALFICPDPKQASAAVEAALGGDSQPSPTPTLGVPTDDIDELLEALLESCEDSGNDMSNLQRLEGSGLEDYITNVYGLSREQWTEAAIARDPETAFEVAVIRASNDGDEVFDGDPPAVIPGGLKTSGAMKEKLDDYLADREGEFDPDSDQGKLLHRAIAGSGGEGDTWYAVLLACTGWDKATDAFVQATGTGFSWTPRYNYLDTDPNYPDRCAFTPPNKDDMSLYDTSAILAAWEAGDPSGLSDYDRDIYDAAQAVLDQVLEDGMSGLEKETVIYGWVVHNVDYDWTHQNIMVPTPRESFTPYGGLVNHTAVCLGYAMTFQLLCDLAEVECITVVGAAFNSEEDHAWNMVRLNGKWYCVDVTWDANYREQGATDWPAEYWNHFNVTSDEMAEENHQWDYANTPEAVTAGNGRD